MNRILSFFAAFLAIGLAFQLVACAESGDRVERFAEAAHGSGKSISVPGYERMSFSAGETEQSVSLKNPPENTCAIVLSLNLEGGETLWTGKELAPGEEFTRIKLSRALDAGEYPATMRYDCRSLEDDTPLNGAEIQLTIEVK